MTAQSPGDDTQAGSTRLKWAREHGLHTVCGPMRRWVAGLAHQQVLDNVRPRPLEKR